MKVKTKISALTLALALCGGALVGCGNDAPAGPTMRNVSCSSDADKYEVKDLQSSYAEGADVSFYVVEKDSENWKVTGVTSDQVTVTEDPTAALHYSFKMPTKNVILRVTTEEVLHYSVSASTDDIAVGNEITFTLKLGTVTRDFTVAKHAGEDKECTINGNKVTFSVDGTYHLDFFDSDAQGQLAVSDYSVNVRAKIPGEDPDNPVSSSAAYTWAGQNITPCNGTSDANYGKAGYLSPKLYVTGKIISLENNPEQDSNVSCTLEGGITTFHMGAKASAEIDVKTITVGSKITIAGWLYCYKTSTAVQFGKDAAKAYNSQIIALDNSQLDSIVIPTELKGVINTTEEIVAQVRPYNGQTVVWTSSNPDVASVAPDAEDSRKATVTYGAAEGTCTIKASIDEVESNVCEVSVSATKQVFRELVPSEVDAAKSYYIAAKDGANLKYAKAEIGTNHYMTAVSDQADAATAKIVKKEGDKYLIKLDSKYLGYQYSDNKYHNILLKDNESDAVEFSYDSEKAAFTFIGTDSSSTKLFLAFYSSSFQYSNYSKYVDSNTHGMFWGWADAIPAQSVTISATLEVNAGSTKSIVVTPVPANADISDGVWATSNDKVATVDDNGKVTGVGAGQCNVTFTLGTLPVQTCQVTVKDVSGGLPLNEAGADFTGCKGTDTAMPENTPWTYKGGTLAFNNGGLKLSYTGATLTSDKLVSSNSITVTLKIGALNENQKTDGDQKPVFEITGLDESKAVIDTEQIETVSATGDVSVTLEASAMRYVVIKFVHFPYKSNGKNCNIRLDKITLA